MEYTDRTKKLIDNVKSHLKSKYGEVKDEWLPLIDLLGENYEMYYKCLDAIELYGIYDVTTGKKNPLLSTCKDLQATIMKQIQHLGLSPYAINRLGNNEDEESSILDDIMMLKE